MAKTKTRNDKISALPLEVPFPTRKSVKKEKKAVKKAQKEVEALKETIEASNSPQVSYADRLPLYLKFKMKDISATSAFSHQITQTVVETAKREGFEIEWTDIRRRQVRFNVVNYGPKGVEVQRSPSYTREKIKLLRDGSVRHTREFDPTWVHTLPQPVRSKFE